jgi:glycosyltransferase involved in cell wall biosynthesis
MFEGIPINNKIVLYASKLQKRKNPLELLKAFEKCLEKIEDISLIFVGTGEEEENLRTTLFQHMVLEKVLPIQLLKQQVQDI